MKMSLKYLLPFQQKILSSPWTYEKLGGRFVGQVFCLLAPWTSLKFLWGKVLVILLLAQFFELRGGPKPLNTTTWSFSSHPPIKSPVVILITSPPLPSLPTHRPRSFYKSHFPLPEYKCKRQRTQTDDSQVTPRLLAQKLHETHICLRGLRFFYPEKKVLLS